jgi:hypothetical protein
VAAARHSYHETARDHPATHYIRVRSRSLLDGLTSDRAGSPTPLMDFHQVAI